jgi:hypothetical protein
MTKAVGLVITVWVLVDLHRIKRTFLFQARFPELKNRIRSHSATFTRHLNRWPDTLPDIEIEMRKCCATLENLLQKVGRDHQDNLNVLLKSIRRYQSSLQPNEESKKNIRGIYLDLVHVEEELKNLNEDSKWRQDS